MINEKTGTMNAEDYEEGHDALCEMIENCNDPRIKLIWDVFGEHCVGPNEQDVYDVMINPHIEPDKE